MIERLFSFLFSAQDETFFLFITLITNDLIFVNKEFERRNENEEKGFKLNYDDNGF